MAVTREPLIQTAVVINIGLLSSSKYEEKGLSVVRELFFAGAWKAQAPKIRRQIPAKNRTVGLVQFIQPFIFVYTNVVISFLLPFSVVLFYCNSTSSN